MYPVCSKDHLLKGLQAAFHTRDLVKKFETRSNLWEKASVSEYETDADPWRS